MSNGSGFRLHWHEGATAQLELFSPKPQGSKGLYQVKYTPRFRATLRPPAAPISLKPKELESINQQLNQLLSTLLVGTSPRTGTPGSNEGAAQGVLQDLSDWGGMLFGLFVPRDVQTDLREGGRFLEFGVDEALLGYPWELMHDGEDFLCLKHFMGRFVNASQVSIPMRQFDTGPPGSSPSALSILVISVPNPQPRSDVTYERLSGAEAETNAILEMLSHIPNVKTTLLSGKQATNREVWRALTVGGYQIVHFTGHANFNDHSPKLSALVLYDQDMTTGPIENYLGKSPPVLCFVNACETGLTASTDWKNHSNIFSVGRAFLETGAYLLGSRWKVADQTASKFAPKFYSCLLSENKSIGQSVMEARLDCKAASSASDFGWASYVFYGDPSVCFRRL